MFRSLGYVTVFIVYACLLVGCIQGGPGLKLKDRVIAEDTVWSGQIQIDGVVTVKKTARLVIEPGTRITFVPRDLDGDGIGDAELLVEGALLARGTRDNPIVFTSAASQPHPADWKYLYLDFCREAELDYIVSEYAYSGLQVHFSRARVTNSTFRHNIDGLRFSTVKLLAAGNRMHDNRHGVRYEERDSQATLHHNEIRDNEVGLFVVMRSEDKVRIEQNNIVGNRQYNVKLGLQQSGDVTMPYNWWGLSTDADIRKTFFDRQVDEGLGTVRAPSPLTGPVLLQDWQEIKE